MGYQYDPRNKYAHSGGGSSAIHEFFRLRRMERIDFATVRLILLFRGHFLHISFVVSIFLFLPGSSFLIASSQKTVQYWGEGMGLFAIGKRDRAEPGRGNAEVKSPLVRRAAIASAEMAYLIPACCFGISETSSLMCSPAPLP